MRIKFSATLSATPGQFTTSQQTGNLCWYIFAATGTLTFKVKLTDGSSYEISRVAGFRARESAPIESFQVASSVASDDIEVWFSDTMEWFLPTDADGNINVNVVTPNPLPTLPFMASPGGDVQLRSDSGLGLETEQLNEVPGVLAITVAKAIPVWRYRTARFVIYSGSAGSTINIVGPDLTLPPCIIYDKFGSVLSRTGNLKIGAAGSAVTVGTEFFVNTAGWSFLNITPTVGTDVVLGQYYSPHMGVPVPADIIKINLADLGIATALTTGRNYSSIIPGDFRRAQVYIKHTSTVGAILTMRAWLCDETGTRTGQVISVSGVASSGPAQEIVWQFSTAVAEQYFQVVGTSQGFSATGPAPLPSFGWQLSVELSANTGTLNNANVTQSQA